MGCLTSTIDPRTNNLSLDLYGPIVAKKKKKKKRPIEKDYSFYIDPKYRLDSALKMVDLKSSIKSNYRCMLSGREGSYIGFGIHAASASALTEPFNLE